LGLCSAGESTADVHLSLGLAAMRGGRADLAENNWRRALELEPNHVRSLYNLGLLEAGRGHVDAAADWWRRALRIDPGNDLIRDQLARLTGVDTAPAPNP
jgi:Flp pilus assembly protein TadD